MKLFGFKVVIRGTDFASDITRFDDNFEVSQEPLENSTATFISGFDSGLITCFDRLLGS